MLLFISRGFLKLLGWQVGGLYPVPEEVRHKCVVIAAPHTSNWDMPIALAIMCVLNIKVRFAIKKEWLFFPMNLLMKYLGAIPIDRSATPKPFSQKSTTQIMIELFENIDHLALIVPAEGTRMKTEQWHTGFYHVARGASVPIAIGFLDYREKKGGILGVLYPTGDITNDMRTLMQYYKNITGKFPANFALDKRYS